MGGPTNEESSGTVFPCSGRLDIGFEIPLTCISESNIAVGPGIAVRADRAVLLNVGTMNSTFVVGPGTKVLLVDHLGVSEYAVTG